ncbi:Hypothetical_protein [Hexamita inflata]|uniref:Hypothetical_protein n=1 Tax=Hexamita inflata TaxID=28002 RepID=A0AA86PG28_9EUKA|nr:Hypothetical protein HINF_LOCUS22747 [Hexamita inflata]
MQTYYELNNKIKTAFFGIVLLHHLCSSNNCTASSKLPCSLQQPWYYSGSDSAWKAHMQPQWSSSRTHHSQLVWYFHNNYILRICQTYFWESGRSKISFASSEEQTIVTHSVKSVLRCLDVLNRLSNIAGFETFKF